MTTAARPHQSTQSEQVFRRIQQTVAGGESSYVRIMEGHLPTVIARGRGSRMWDVDGNEYIDYNEAYGPLHFGHLPGPIVDAVADQITRRGSDYGFPHELDYQVGELMTELVPGLAQVRFANSGTEAVASALRLARAYTNRPKIVRFEGHYHGWSEAIFIDHHPSLEAAGPEEWPNLQPGSAGMAIGALDDLILVSWNRPDLIEAAFRERGGEIAAVITEPVMGNTGVVPPEPGYLELLRELTRSNGSLLIFDEVITGFRVNSGGASRHYGVTPDIWTFAKALGGGFPTAAFGGTAEVMRLEAENRVFHGGTYAASPMTLAASRAALQMLKDGGDDLTRRLTAHADRLGRELKRMVEKAGFHCVVQGVGPMFQLFFTDRPVEKLVNYRATETACDKALFRDWQHAAQRNGVYFHPSQYECFFVSTAITDEDIDETLARMESATDEVRRSRS